MRPTCKRLGSFEYVLAGASVKSGSGRAISGAIPIFGVATLAFRISTGEFPRPAVNCSILIPFDTNWNKGGGATPLATQDLVFGGAISIPTAPTNFLETCRPE